MSYLHEVISAPFSPVAQGEVSVRAAMSRARYDFAAKFCHGKRVIDLGCGNGVGTSVIRKVAQTAHGFDTDNGFDVEKDLSKGIHGPYFNIWIRHGGFDVVTMLEVIEHLNRPERALENVKRLLSDDGTFICSTPNVRFTKGTNVHHVHEYTVKEFLRLMVRHFSDVHLLGMEKRDGSQAVRALRQLGWDRPWLRKLLRLPTVDELTNRHYPITGDLERAYCLIAVCRRPL
ncbi:MAG: class I SAM-dependent methyltransferase [Planctomycetota bacterium]|jgi:ubiquinone/menaquinone biosynthesis C-methylase UbiE